MRLPLYTKTIVAVVGAVLAVVMPSVSGDMFLDTTEITTMGLAILTALGVYSLPNGRGVAENDLR